MRWYLLAIALALTIAGSLDKSQPKPQPQLEPEVEVAEKIEDIPKPEELGEQAPAPDVDPLTPPLKPCEVDPSKIDCVLEMMEL